MKMFYGGAEIPSHRQLLGRLEIPHVALSYMGLRRRTKRTDVWLVSENFSAGQAVLIDSGCHTLNREGVEVAQSEISEIAERYDSFIAQNLDAIEVYTEFDALAMGREWIEERRSALDPEKSIVVWHEEWGVDELRRMADKYPYIAVGQGTCGDRDIVPILRSLSRNRRLHGMGFSSPPLMLAADWHSLTSTTWLSAAQHGETFVWAGRELKRYPNRYKGQARKRHRTLFERIGLDPALIEQDDPTENLRLSLWSWQQQIAFISQRHGEGVAASPDESKSGSAESTGRGVEVTTSETGNEGVTSPPVGRAKRVLPGLEMEAFTHRYTDPDDGERKSRTEYRATAVDLNIRTCDACFLARKCPEYRPGESCAYEIPIKVRTKEQYVALLDSLITMQAARVFSMRMSEEVEGGYADPNLSQEMDRLAKYVKLKSEIEEAGFSLTMRVQQKGEAQVGLLSRLFGEKAGGVPALSPAGTVSAEEALGQLGVVDAEVVE